MKKKENHPKKATKDENKVSEKDRINTDPFGSYTGVDTENKYEIPVQDVDDL